MGPRESVSPPRTAAAHAAITSELDSRGEREREGCGGGGKGEKRRGEGHAEWRGGEGRKGKIGEVLGDLGRVYGQCGVCNDCPFSG